jgi:hypothetical protein
MIESFSRDQVEAFHRDGFAIVEQGLVSERALERLRERYLPLFDGEYETGIPPDEVNWVPGRDAEDRTRQLCNAWKSDTVVVAQVLSERTGRLAVQLMGYRGVRILQSSPLRAAPRKASKQGKRKPPSTWRVPAMRIGVRSSRKCAAMSSALSGSAGFPPASSTTRLTSQSTAASARDSGTNRRSALTAALYPAGMTTTEPLARR